MNATRAMRAVAGGTLLAVLASGVLAQGAGIVLPGQVERQFRMLPQPRGDSGVPQLPTPPEAVPPQAGSLRFRVQSIVLDGVNRLEASVTDPLIERYQDREVSLGDLYQLAAELSAAYRERGYLLSQVIVPAQEVRDGQVRLQAVEGHVDQVVIEGGEASERDLVLRFGMKIRAEKPLTNAALERYMLLINDLPGIYAYATLSPSADRFAAADLHIHLNERRFDAGVSVDNRGGRVLGSERLIADVAVADVFGRHDNSSLKGVASPGGEMTYLALRHEQPLGRSEERRVGKECRSRWSPYH